MDDANILFIRQQQPRRHKYKMVSPTKIAKFQLWNNQTNTWNERVLKKVTIILTEQDLINWQHFRTQKLKFNQLYLWYQIFNYY